VGLTGAYFANETFSGSPALTRVDPNIDHDWYETPGEPVPEDHFSVRWTGQIIPPTSDNYHFGIDADDGARVWVNGAQLIDVGPGSNLEEGAVDLIGGNRYDIVVEFFEVTDRALIQLWWSTESDSIPWEIVPAKVLRAASSDCSTSCDDGNPCTSDACANGSCTHTNLPDGILRSTTCGVGACAATGNLTCTGGVPHDDCTAGTPAPNDATCNGVDNDCNGATDEDYAPVTTSCGVGACASSGTTSCVNGAIVDSCQAGTPAANDATCNGIDDDCNGTKDEDYIRVATTCGAGACASTGLTACMNGTVVDDCHPQSPALNDAACNGIDDDCDGSTDEDYAPVATTCGIGPCAATGTTSCMNGQVVDSCQPGAGAANDSTCNGTDDDCNGSIDEDYVARTTTCGEGACRSEGGTSCVAGQEQDSCTPGTPAANDATCDGVDADCDGQVDENYVPRQSTCGVGACASTGTTSCVQGQEMSNCQPGTPAANDATCNGIDEDCNGNADEDYAPVSTTCGVGACASTGTTSCIGGQVVSTCAPRSPAANDATCDLVDDDCNGVVDEDYVPHATACGVGACASTGTTSCAVGQETDTCQAGAPAQNDATCDGVDNDCNGTNDEDYVSVPTTCGVGACTASGTTACVNGAVVNGCTPGAPAPNDATCNGVDEDCNGTNDEDFVESCEGASVRRCVGGQVATNECSDNDACTGAESCSGGQCVPGAPPVLDDGNPCTQDVCSPSTGVSHTPVLAGTPCGPGQTCNTQGVCVVNSAPPAIVTQPTALHVSVNQPFQFTVVATGSDLQYQWQRFGADIPGANAATYSGTSAAFSDDGGIFRCIVHNALGSVTSAEAKLTVTDDQPPVVTIDGPAARQTTATFATLTGTATDPGAGVQTVVVVSNRFSGQSFGGVVDAQGRFTAEVPLRTGDNALTVKARDRAGNEATASVLITQTLTTVPIVVIESPAFGATLTTDTITVSGTVRSSLPPEQVRLTLGNAVVFPTGSGGVYAFSFPGVRLVVGPNTLVVRAETPQGSSSAETTVQFQPNGGGNQPNPPRIAVNTGQAETFITGDRALVSGTVDADTCVASVTVNGSSARVTGSGPHVSFDAEAPFPTGASTLTITVEATDCGGLHSSVSYTVRRDATAPVINVAGLAAAPAVNAVLESPYTVRGTVTEADLAGLTTNNQSIGVLPAAAPDTWDFSFTISLARGQESSVVLEAWDRANNRTRREILLRLDAVVAIEILSPAAGANLIGTTEPPVLAVSARLTNLAPTDTVHASVDGGSAVALATAGTLATGSVPVTTGDHVLAVEVRGSGGPVAARSTVNFRFTPASAVPLTVARIDPPNGAVNVEVNQPIGISFSKAINPTLLQVNVVETVHGKVFKRLEPGADLATLSDVGTVEVHRDLEPVPGGLSNFPGDVLAAFYPTREYGYGGTVFVTVKYDDHELARASFQLRPLPTLVEGFIVDTELLPLPGVSIELAELGISTTTNMDGYYSFGFGRFENALVGGRYRMRVNAGLAKSGLGTLEYWLNAQQRSLTSNGILRLSRLGAEEPFRHVRGGDTTVQLASGRLDIGLANAQLVFPGGPAEGDVHAQLVMRRDLNYSGQRFANPQFAYALEPGGVSVSGTVTVSMALPEIKKSFAYLDASAPHAVLIGLDPDALQFLPVGVARVDKAGLRLTSEGRVELRRLDYIGVSIQGPSSEPILAAYAAGEIGIRELISQLSAKE
jgi:hypothetical protein